MNPDHTPLVTVYITSHNYGRFIVKAIESVLNQSFQDFELIIIDDGSTDDSREIITKYAGHEKVINVFQKNKGLNVSNNVALRMARGDYILRLDADDWMDENALQVMSGVLERNPNTGLVFPDYFHVDTEGNILDVVRRLDFDEEVGLLDQPAHGACTLIRRKCLQQIEGYDETFRCQDGYDLWIRFIEHFEVTNVNLPLFYYRQHEENLTKDSTQILDTRAQILKRSAHRKGRHLETLSVIPVRGNHLDPATSCEHILGDRPLIDWTIQAAIEAERSQDVIITSPDVEILFRLNQRWGDAIICLERPAELAQQNTVLTDTVRHALEAYESNNKSVQAIMVLGLNAPFRTAQYIDAAVDVMELFETDAVIGVIPETRRFYRHNGNGLKPLQSSPGLRLEREVIYRECGGIQLFSRRHLSEKGTDCTDIIGHVVLDQLAGLTLFNRFDWELAEKLAGDLVDTSTKKDVA
jgi:CMP-N-acetylneuraminic acid synthetase